MFILFFVCVSLVFSLFSIVAPVSLISPSSYFFFRYHFLFIASHLSSFSFITLPFCAIFSYFFVKLPQLKDRWFTSPFSSWSFVFILSSFWVTIYHVVTRISFLFCYASMCFFYDSYIYTLYLYTHSSCIHSFILTHPDTLFRITRYRKGKCPKIGS